LGGFGSGTWLHRDKRTTTDAVNRLDIRIMRKKGCFRSNSLGFMEWSRGGVIIGALQYEMTEDHMTLWYRYDGLRQRIEETIWFDWTSCHYGGWRPWFSCPQCDRRVAVLYWVGPRFLCRHCHELPYSSQHETFVSRMHRKRRKIRERLGVSGSLIEPIRLKPRGMHWQTFWRLVQQERAAEHRAIAACF
jgi:YD repeat-containing protein